MENSYHGKCRVCGGHVPAKQGIAERVVRGWKSVFIVRHPGCEPAPEKRPS